MKRMKQFLSVGLASAMAVMMVACGGEAQPAAEPKTDDTKEEEVKVDEPEVEDVAEGDVLNIQVWNEEFKSRVTDHYPGYEEVDSTTGKIGDVTVNWTITPSDDNAYQNNLDAVLPGNEDADAASKVDIFLVEADYALKYVDADADVAMKLSDLGISNSDLSDQYQYTKDVVTDQNGDLRGSSWQACSAGLIYNREIAKKVLGADDVDTVQAAVKDWATYNQTAAQMKAAGYYMSSTVNDTYRVYSNNVSAPWVKDGKVTVDSNIEQWVTDSKAQVDAGQTTTADLWSDDWSKGFMKDPGNVFCYFGPAWFFNFCLHADEADSIAADGGWGYTTGPQGFYWGGTWICAANGTDNPTLVKDIILTMTTDPDVLKEIATADSDCVNSKAVLADLSGSDDGNIALLGGQNPYKELAEGAELVDMSNISPYDQGCNESFQAAMKDYFDGNADLDTAMAAFKTAVQEKYPELEF